MAYAKYPYLEYLELEQRYGHEDAYWSCSELLKHYRQIVSIQTIPDLSSSWKHKAREFAAFFGKAYSETKGDIGLLLKLAKGQPGGKVFRVMPSRRLSKTDFE